MRYISLCDGIGAAHEAWSPLGWTCVARAEIDAFPLAVTAQRQPGPRELGDVSKIAEEDIALLGPVDLVIFGSPCQDLSVAGQRKGLAGARSGLFFDCLRVFFWAQQHCGARFALWENVPGAFSSHKGADFALVVGAMAGCDDLGVPAHGWGSEGCAVGDHGVVEWAVLDAQWFGLAQRRKRVFALLDTGDWTRRPPILLEREGLRGNSPPRRAQGQGVTHAVAQSLTASGRGVERTGEPRGQDPVVAVEHGSALAFDVKSALAPHGGGKASTTAYPLKATGHKDQQTVAYGFTAKDYGQDAGEELAPTLRSGAFTDSHANGGVMPAVAFALRGREGGAMPEVQGDQVGALRAASGGSTRSYVAFNARQDPCPADVVQPLDTDGTSMAISDGYAVRRLTPVECHRLQGFADNHCAVTYRKKPAADGPIYKALGNSMAIPCVRWIGEQIEIALLY